MQVQAKLSEEELQKVRKKGSKFGNIFFDMLYNIISYVPAAIITWFITQLE